MSKHLPTIRAICYCGKAFTVPGSRSKTGRGKYCCRQCFINSPDRAAFYTNRSKAMVGNCLCRGRTGAWTEKKMPDEMKLKMRLSAKRGSESRLWRGGRTTLRRAIRALPQYKEWRFVIFQRDNFVCQICNNKPGYVEADHYPSSFDMILTKHKISTIDEAGLCRELWDTNNGRTVCKACHKDYTTRSHQRYSRHGNK